MKRDGYVLPFFCFDNKMETTRKRGGFRFHYTDQSSNLLLSFRNSKIDIATRSNAGQPRSPRPILRRDKSIRALGPTQPPV